MLRAMLLVAAGGAIGSVLRFLVSHFTHRTSDSFPAATFAVNMIGCLLIGFFAGLISKNSLSNELRLFLVTGLCGGYTTFSAFGIESLSLIKSGNLIIASLYITLSVTLGIAAVFVGMQLAEL